MTDTMGSSMASSTRLGSSYISCQHTLLTWGYGKPEDGKGPPQISLSYFHQLRRKPRGPFPLTKPAELKDMGGFPTAQEPFLMGGRASALTMGFLRTNLTDSCREMNSLKAKPFPLGIPILGPWGNTLLLPSQIDSLSILPSPHPPGASSLPASLPYS